VSFEPEATLSIRTDSHAPGKLEEASGRRL
jgi:hypothetical protein